MSISCLYPAFVESAVQKYCKQELCVFGRHCEAGVSLLLYRSIEHLSVTFAPYSGR